VWLDTWLSSLGVPHVLRQREQLFEARVDRIRDVGSSRQSASVVIPRSVKIEQIDAVIRSLDEMREDAGMSKAELARRVGRNPASIRRLFTAEQARPELPLIISIANALDASIEIKRRPRRSSSKRAAVRA
jgi:DNA-binding XRE family transcriptional regulator